MLHSSFLGRRSVRGLPAETAAKKQNHRNGRKSWLTASRSEGQSDLADADDHTRSIGSLDRPRRHFSIEAFRPGSYAPYVSRAGFRRAKNTPEKASRPGALLYPANRSGR